MFTSENKWKTWLKQWTFKLNLLDSSTEIKKKINIDPNVMIFLNFLLYSLN